MSSIHLFPKDFPNMPLLDQIDALIDVYGMTMMITGNSKLKENMEMLKEVKKECIRRNSSFDIFDLMGPEFTKEEFKKIRSQPILSTK
jgi:hypothetical protein